MPVQPQPMPAQTQPDDASTPRTAPLWLQRMSLFILVLFCVYLGVIVAALPWWPSVWDQNPLFTAHPQLLAFLRHGLVRGFISGLGLLDIWIGVSEAIHYREHAAPRI